MQTKKSLFALRMGLSQTPSDQTSPLQTPIREKDPQELKRLQSSHTECDPKGFPKAQSILVEQPSQEEIHTQNLSRIQGMSPSEIQNALSEIQSSIPKHLVEFLKKRGQKKNIKPAPQPPTASCMHSNKVPCLLPEKYRFDIQGSVVQEYLDSGWEPSESSGFSLLELALMIRSTLPAQRALALSSVLYVLDRNQKFSFQIGFDYLVENCEFEKILVSSLDDSNKNVLVEATRLLAFIVRQKARVIKPFDLVLTFKNNSLVSKEAKAKLAYWEEEESRVQNYTLEANSNDFLGHLVRLGILRKITSVFGKAQEEGVYFNLQEVLLSLAMHSVSAAYEIARNNELLATLSLHNNLKVFCFIVKAAVSIAYKVKRLTDWETKLINNIWSNQRQVVKDSLVLAYAFYCHNQRFEAWSVLRGQLLEICNANDQGVIAYAYYLLERVLCTLKNTSEFKAFTELAIYKFLASSGSLKTHTAVVKFLKTYYAQGGCLGHNSEFPDILEYLTNLMSRHQLESCKVKVTSEVASKHLFSPQELVSEEHLEKKLLRVAEFHHYSTSLISLLSLSTSGLEGILSSTLETCSNTLSNFKEQFKSAIPESLVYRLKPLTYLCFNLIKLCGAQHLDKILNTIVFLGPYDESILESLLRMISEKTPKYYLGFLSSQKHLELSDAYFKGSTKLPTQYLSMTESQFLPLPFDWLFLPLTQESEVNEYLEFIGLCLPQAELPSYTEAIKHINLFFMRKDINYTDYLCLLKPILKHIAECPKFFENVSAIKNNILDLGRDYLANSFLEEEYTRWVSCFLRDQVDSEVSKELYCEIEVLGYRFKNSLKDPYGGWSAYQNFLANLE